jgi:hypothetical protein
MRKNYRITLFLVFILIFLSGCAVWQLIKPYNKAWRYSLFDVEMPEGWVKYNSPYYLLFLTKDGSLLQSITITRHHTDKEFPLSKKKINKDMMIQEIATIIADERNLNREELLNFTLLEDKPVNIGGIEGFKMAYTFNTADFVKYEAIMYGFIVSKYYYEVEYLAAKQHFFTRDLPDFEAFIDSFKVVKD